MKQHISASSLLVDDYDTAIAYYCGVLDFALIEDTPLSIDKRWVLVAPKGAHETRLLLARAATPDQAAFIGNQSGGRVFLILYTDDFARDHAAYTSKGVTFIEPARHEPYGRVAVFKDIYGNLWDLLEPKSA